MTFEGSVQWGEPSKRSRKWIRMDLRTISRSAPGVGQGNSPYCSYRNSKDIVGWIHSKSPDIERERRDVPPLDRFSTRDRGDTKDTNTIIWLAEGSDDASAVVLSGTQPGEHFLGATRESSSLPSPHWTICVHALHIVSGVEQSRRDCEGFRLSRQRDRVDTEVLVNHESGSGIVD